MTQATTNPATTLHRNGRIGGLLRRAFGRFTGAPATLPEAQPTHGRSLVAPSAIDAATRLHNLANGACLRR